MLLQGIGHRSAPGGHKAKASIFNSSSLKHKPSSRPSGTVTLNIDPSEFTLSKPGTEAGPNESNTVNLISTFNTPVKETPFDPDDYL